MAPGLCGPRALNCIGKKLKSKLSLCSTLFCVSRTVCLFMLLCWHNYNSYSIRRLRVAYNYAFRMIHGLPRHTTLVRLELFVSNLELYSTSLNRNF